MLQVIDNATAYNLQLDPAQSFANVTFRVSGDGSAGTAIVPVQHVIVSSGQVVSGATVASANVQDVYGTAINANVQNGGEQDVYSGGTGSGTLISSGGVQAVFAGGTASAATVSSGGVQYVSSSGIALAATIASGGYQSVASGGFASNTLVTGGEQDVSAGAGARDTTISGGIEQIQPGANVGGTIGLLGSGSTLKLVGTQTFDGATVAIGYTTGATLLSQDVAGAAATLTLGPNLMITHAGALAALGTSVAASSVVNQGTVNANFAGGDFDITAASFTNQHLISVANGDTLAVGSTQFTNTAAGTVTVGAGTLALGYQSLLVDFEDLTGSGEFGISNPYHGFTWETPGHNFDWLNGTTLPADSGYQIDNIAPGHNVAYDGFAQQPIDIKRADGSSFIFQSVDLAAAWDPRCR